MRSLLITVVLGVWLATACGCSAQRSAQWLANVGRHQRPYAVYGTIVNADEVRVGWVVIHRGVITDITDDESRVPRQAVRIKTDSYLYPGLIDTHNHPHYAAVPSWRAGRVFANRYEWIADQEYKQNVQQVYNKGRKDGVSYLFLKYGEVRALIGGTTSLQGSYVPAESKILVRNLEDAYLSRSFTPNIRFLKGDRLNDIKTDLHSGALRRVYLHIAEGVDQLSAQEFDVLEEKGLLRPGVVVIHGVALKTPHFQKMAGNGLYLVWSPKSNLVLYGKTADVLAAMEAGVTVSLAPDWTVTGSDNLLEEMKVAYKYSQDKLGGKITAKDIFRLATADAARVAGVSRFLGRIRSGYAADLFITSKLDGDPYRSLLKATPKDVQMVFVDGDPLFGNLERLKGLADGAIDKVTVEGTTKGLIMVGDLRYVPHADERFTDVMDRLKNAVDEVAPLIED